MEFKILLASASPLKRDAIIAYFRSNYPTIKPLITCVDCDPCNLPPQPINCGEYCTYQRSKYAMKNTTTQHDMVIAIENDLQNNNGIYYDRAHVRVEMGGLVGTGMSKPIFCPINGKDIEGSEIVFSNKIRGHHTTGGELMKKTFGYDPKNWMKHTAMIDRVDQIIDSLTVAFNDLRTNINNCHKIAQSYTTYPNFPKEGVAFKYFYSLFVNRTNMEHLGKILQSKYTAYEIDAVLPLESRGLVLGALLADRLQVSMIPMQKPGKIPGESISVAYTKEYGTDEIQASVDLFSMLMTKKKKFYRFMVVDDLVASGGSVESVLKILEMVASKYEIEYEVVVLTLDEVAPLRETAMAKLKIDYDVLFRNIDDTYKKMASLTKN